MVVVVGADIDSLGEVNVERIKGRRKKERIKLTGVTAS